MGTTIPKLSILLDLFSRYNLLTPICSIKDLEYDVLYWSMQSDLIALQEATWDTSDLLWKTWLKLRVEQATPFFDSAAALVPRYNLTAILPFSGNF